MKARPLIIALSLCAGLLISLSFRYQVTHLRQEQRRTVWLAYVRGPLKLYVQGSRDGALLLKPRRLSAKQKNRLGDAVEAIDQSWTEVSAQQQDFQADTAFGDLDQAVLWHTTASQLADTWPKLDRSDLSEMSMARQAQRGIQRNLAIRVSQEWAVMQQELAWSPAELAESQAAVDALMKPLP
ncbi:MAG TPA: hypothetical protein VK914_00265 [bacterium]|jgi:hypothetical protein|nr:hypothetical protein [bacterium]